MDKYEFTYHMEVKFGGKIVMRTNSGTFYSVKAFNADVAREIKFQQDNGFDTKTRIVIRRLPDNFSDEAYRLGRQADEIDMRLRGVDWTLRDVLPREALGPEYDDDCSFRKLLDCKVIREHGVVTNPQDWPGREKNVQAWWELEGGSAVGWNENMSRGWSFPTIRYSAISRARRNA